MGFDGRSFCRFIKVAFTRFRHYLKTIPTSLVRHFSRLYRSSKVVHLSETFSSKKTTTFFCQQQIQVCWISEFVLRDQSPLECSASTSTKVIMSLDMVPMMTLDMVIMTPSTRREAMELARLEVKLCSIRGSSQGGTRSQEAKTEAGSPVGLMDGANICIESPTRMVDGSSTNNQQQQQCSTTTPNNPAGSREAKSPILAAPSAARWW